MIMKRFFTLTLLFLLPSSLAAAPYTGERFGHDTPSYTGFANSCSWEKIIDWGDVNFTYDSFANQDTFITTYDASTYAGGYQTAQITTEPGFSAYLTIETETPFANRQVRNTIALDNAAFGNPTVNNGNGSLEPDDVLKFTRLPNFDNDFSTLGDENLKLTVTFPKKYAYYSYKVYDVDQASFIDKVTVSDDSNLDTEDYITCPATTAPSFGTPTETELTGQSGLNTPVADNDPDNACHINNPDQMNGPDAANDANFSGTNPVLIFLSHL